MALAEGLRRITDGKAFGMFDGIDTGLCGDSKGGLNDQPADLVWGMHDADARRLCWPAHPDAAPWLREALRRLGDTAADEVVLDFAAVTSLDGTSVGAIAFLYRRLAARGRRLAIAGATGQPVVMLHQLGLARLLTTERSRRGVLFSRRFGALAAARTGVFTGW